MENAITFVAKMQCAVERTGEWNQDVKMLNRHVLASIAAQRRKVSRQNKKIALYYIYLTFNFDWRKYFCCEWGRGYFLFSRLQEIYFLFFLNPVRHPNGDMFRF